jgi:hypothetical protein
MQIRNWQEFYDSLSHRHGYGAPVPKPTVEQLDRFEAESGFRLPRSYRDFILVFGPGEFSVGLRIAAPGYGYVPHPPGVDLLVTSQSYGWSEEDVAQGPVSMEQKAHLLRLFYFGLEDERQWLGWDPKDMQAPEESEYGIYRVEALGFGTELIAKSFRELVEVTCARLFTPNPQWDEEELGPQRTFRPAYWLPAP